MTEVEALRLVIEQQRKTIDLLLSSIPTVCVPSVWPAERQTAAPPSVTTVGWTGYGDPPLVCVSGWGPWEAARPREEKQDA